MWWGTAESGHGVMEALFEAAAPGESQHRA